LLALALAMGVQLLAPRLWPLAWVLLALSLGFAGGNAVVASFRRTDFAVLPMVRLLRGDSDHVLDAGCGAGRTTLALGRVLGRGRVTAVDRFSAAYIRDGGRSLLDHNLEWAGLAQRVDVVRADLTALPFAASSFDSAVSTAVFDHLGAAKRSALSEVFRVLKPGGRFLVAVWVPSWTTFMVGNVLSFFLSPRSAWKGMASGAGFRLVEDGVHNFSWYMLLEKPE
jgi:SAM-dependent methyltransferase